MEIDRRSFLKMSLAAGAAASLDMKFFSYAGAAVASKEAGVETPNELRSLINREPLTEGGDDLYWPVTQAPIGSDVFTGDNPKVMDDDAETEDPEVEEEEDAE